MRAASSCLNRKDMHILSDLNVCDDDSDFFYKDNESKDCAWVGRWKSKRCSLRSEGLNLSAYCPLACEACDCHDEPYFEFKDDPRKGCRWVRKRKDKRCHKTWEGEKLFEYCPDACGLCTA